VSNNREHPRYRQHWPTVAARLQAMGIDPAQFGRGGREYPRLETEPAPDLAQAARGVAQTLMDRLRRWRVEQALPRHELARLSGVPVVSIKRAERLGAISLERWMALALAVGLADELHELFARRTEAVPSLVLRTRSARQVRGSMKARRRGRDGPAAARPPR
jgi:hypothetical protein